jgi:preprotein translocase subunit SecE
MARDRKRAKQRQRQRRSQRRPQPVPGSREAAAEAMGRPEAEPDTVADAPPDPVEHASGDAEIAEAAEHAVAELDGPTTPLQADEYPQPDELEGADALDEVEEREPELAGAGGGGRRRGRRGAKGSDGGGGAEAAAPRPAPAGRELPREGNRFANFLRACWAELQRVQWPDRRQVAQATGVVLVFVLIAGGYLGLLDAIFSRVVDAIL